MNRFSVEVLPAVVEEDLFEAYWWYEDQQKGLGERFERAYRQALDKLTSMALAYQVRYEPQKRMIPLEDFAYSLHYRVTDQKHVKVFALMAQKDDPTKWNKRD